MAASSDALGNLHKLFADYWLEQLNRVEEVYDEDGYVVGTRPVPLTAAEAAVLRAFLKDNNVQADPAGDQDVKELAGHLREATKGTVKPNELDDILDQFMAATPGIGPIQ